MPIVYESEGGGGGSGTVQSVTAADTSIVVAGTAANPTVKTGTLDVIAADHPPAADWSNNSHKITSLANGTSATDAAAFGQIPVGGTGLVKLFESTLGGAAASIDTGANGIAGGHGDLIVYFIARTTDAGASAGIHITVNGDTGAHYDQQYVQGNGATASAATSLAQTAWQVAVHGNGGTASYPGLQSWFFPAYSATTFFKVAETHGTQVDGTAGSCQSIHFMHGWRSTAAINQLTFAGLTGNLQAGSRLVIYGTQ